MKTAVIFPGYGSQFVGMGKELYDESRVMQEYFEEASNCLNINFVKLCFASSDAEISRIDNALVANFLVSSAFYAIIKEIGVTPNLVLGHSSGEYAAIFAAGGISFPDMLYMLHKYTNFYQDLLASVPIRAIRVTGLDRDTLVTMCRTIDKESELIGITAYESQTEHVVSGETQYVDHIAEQAKEAGAKKVIELMYVDGLHAPLMKSVYDSMVLYSEKVDFKDLQIPLMANTNTKIITTKEEVKEEMMLQLVSPLHWDECAEKLGEYDLLIEVGPGTVLSDKLKKMYPDKMILSINKGSDVELLKEKIIAKTEPTTDNQTVTPE